MLSKMVWLSILSLVLAACSYGGPVKDRSEDHIVGTTLSSISSLTSDVGSQENKVAIYDETIQKIHQFDLNLMVHERTLQPTVPGGKHFVLYEQNGNYVVDLTAKRLSIFNKAGTLNDQPIQFVGTPVSGAFRPSLGYLVIYDDRQSVGMLQLGTDGNVTNSWVGGPIVSGNFSISAGDIDDQGHLILVLSDDSVAIVDLAQSMAQRKWVLVKPAFASGLVGISWVAPVHDQPGQVLLLTATQVALLDLSAQTVLSTYAIDSHHTVAKTGKVFDPHILLANGNETDLIYPKASQLVAVTTYYQVNHLLLSRLSLAHDSWTMIDSTAPRTYVGHDDGGIWRLMDDPNSYKKSRQLRRYRVSDLLAQSQVSLPDEAQLEVTEDSVFELFPSALGNAVNYSISKGTRREANFFNMPYLHH